MVLNPILFFFFSHPAISSVGDVHYSSVSGKPYSIRQARNQNGWEKNQKVNKHTKFFGFDHNQTIIHRVVSCEVVVFVGFDHINRNPPVPIRTPKLTRFEPAQYQPGTVVLNPILFFSRPAIRSSVGGRSLLEPVYSIRQARNLWEQNPMNLLARLRK